MASSIGLIYQKLSTISLSEHIIVTMSYILNYALICINQHIVPFKQKCYLACKFSHESNAFIVSKIEFQFCINHSRLSLYIFGSYYMQCDLVWLHMLYTIAYHFLLIYANAKQICILLYSQVRQFTFVDGFRRQLTNKAH